MQHHMLILFYRPGDKAIYINPQMVVSLTPTKNLLCKISLRDGKTWIINESCSSVAFRLEKGY